MSERNEPSGTESRPAAEQTGEQVGLGARLDEVDLEQSQQVGADPPGGLGTDIGGGSGLLGEDQAADQAG